MTPDDSHDVTALLQAVRDGEPQAVDGLIAVVLPELLAIAGGFMRRERAGHSLSPTALVNEVYLRLMKQPADDTPANRRQFFAVAANLMRNILVDHARQRKAEKRGGEFKRVPLDVVLEHYEQNNIDVLTLHEVLDELGRANERWQQVLTLRYFAGCSVKEISDTLGISERTIHNDHEFGLAFVRRRMQKAEAP